MGLQSPRSLFDNASRGNYGIGAFNVFSMETLLAVLEAAETEHSPAIIQMSMGSRKYLKHWKVFLETMKRYAELCPVPLFVQHDHCTSVDACKEAVDADFQAVMFDGSHLEYEENIRLTAEVTAYAHARGVWVEAELGSLPGAEDMITSADAVHTDPARVVDYIERSGCDALSVAVGTSHGGVPNDGYLPFHFDLFAKIAAARPGFPFVLHGGASLPPELIDQCNRQGGMVEYLRNCSEDDIRRAVGMGARKVNMDVDNYLGFTIEVRRHLNEKPEIYDPQKYLLLGREGFRREVAHKMKAVMLSSNRA